MIKNYILIMLMFNNFIFCCKNNWEGKIYYDKYDIKIIENYQNNIIKNNSIQLIEDLIIGNESLVQPFYNISGVEVDNNGNIYVLDTGNFRFIKFDKNGSYIFMKGRKGTGPGEFQEPVCMQLFENNLYIYDRKLRRINKFDCSGNFLCLYYIENYNVRYFDLISKNTVLLTTWNFGVYGSFAYKYNLINENGKLIIKKIFNSGLEIPKGTNISMGARYELYKNKYIYFISPYPYEIIKYTFDGDIITKIIKKDTRIKEPEIKIYNYGKTISIKERGKISPGFIYQDSLLIINCHSLKNNNYQYNYFIDFFNIEGKYLYSFQLDDSEKLVNVTDNKLYFINSSLDEKIIRRKVEFKN